MNRNSLRAMTIVRKCVAVGFSHTSRHDVEVYDSIHFGGQTFDRFIKQKL